MAGVTAFVAAGKVAGVTAFVAAGVTGAGIAFVAAGKVAGIAFVAAGVTVAGIAFVADLVTGAGGIVALSCTKGSFNESLNPLASGPKGCNGLRTGLTPSGDNKSCWAIGCPRKNLPTSITPCFICRLFGVLPLPSASFLSTLGCILAIQAANSFRANSLFKSSLLLSKRLRTGILSGIDRASNATGVMGCGAVTGASSTTSVFRAITGARGLISFPNKSSGCLRCGVWGCGPVLKSISPCAAGVPLRNLLTCNWDSTGALAA